LGRAKLCLNETGFHPTIHVQSYSATTTSDGTTHEASSSFAFIPAALSYILQELLKNSSVATAAKMKEESPINRPISVVVCADDCRVMIHVGDLAGGIPFDVGKHIWSYLYTTTKRNEQSADLEKSGATELGGFGVGLPLSRLYARYLGGSLNLVSLPGYGTHAYVFLPRLPENLVEVVPIRNGGWAATTKFFGEFIL
jgi:signal transduction histidine kinase